MVSTGVLRYDKRGGQDNPVKLSNLNNKRQQSSCSCSVSCDAALSRPYREGVLRPSRCVKSVVNVHRDFALVSVIHKRATEV